MWRQLTRFALELRLEGRVRSSAGQGPGGCRTPPAPLPNNVSASRPIATVYGGGLQHVETGQADWVLTRRNRIATARELGLEEIVSERAGDLYRSETSRSWLKSKNPAFVRT